MANLLPNNMAFDQTIMPSGDPSINLPPGMFHIGKFTKPKAQKGREASFLSQAESKLVDDIPTRVRILAENRFPDLPEEKRLKKYTILNDSTIAYEHEGQLYRALDDGLIGFATDIIGHSPAEIGAIAGAMSGGVPGMMAGAAGGEALRQAYGSAVYDQPVDLARSAGSMAWEAAVPGMIVGAQRAAVGGARRLLDKKRIPNQLGYDPVETARNYQRAKDEGVYLSPAEASGSRHLAAQQSMLAENPVTSDQIQDMYRRRATQVEDSINRNLNALSPQDSAYDAQRRSYDAMVAERQRRVDYRKSQSKPKYVAAESEHVDILDIVENVKKQALESEGTPVGQVYRKMYNALTKRGEEGRVPKTQIKWLHGAKTQLDDILARVERAGGAITPDMMELKQSLVESLGRQSELYNQGRLAYKRTSPPVNELDNLKAAKIIPKRKFDESDVEKMAKATLGPDQSKVNILVSRKILKRTDPEAWDGLVRTWLQERLDLIKEGASGGEIPNLAGRFRKLVFGSKKDKDKLKVALKPNQYQAMENMFEVLRAASRVTRGQSATQPRQAMERRFESGLKSRLAAAAQPRQTIIDGFLEDAKETNMKAAADLITNTKTMQEFNIAARKLRQYGPNTPQYDRSKYLDALAAAIGSLGATYTQEMPNHSQ